MKTLYSNNKDSIYPTRLNSNAYDNTYLLDIQFDLQDFQYENEEVLNKRNHFLTFHLLTTN